MENKTETKTAAQQSSYEESPPYCVLIALNPLVDLMAATSPFTWSIPKIERTRTTTHSDPIQLQTVRRHASVARRAPSLGQESSYQFEAGWRMIDRFVIKNGRLDAAPAGIMKQRCTKYGSWSLGQIKP
ncbi:unnamed protein product [Penicillium pancosmium]